MAPRTTLVQIFQRSLRAWWDDDALRLGASLSFYTLFAIAPVLLVSIAIAGLVFGAEAVRGELVGQMDDLVGREGAQAVQALLEGASKRQSGIFATIVGTVTLLLAATGAFLELQAAFNAIWRVKPNPSLNLRAYAAARLRSFASSSRLDFCCSCHWWLARPCLPLMAGWADGHLGGPCSCRPSMSSSRFP